MTRTNKIKLTILALSLFFSASLQAQWNFSGSNIYNSNSGNVGIGTSSPTQKLDIRGKLNVTNGGGGFDIIRVSAYGASGLPSVVIGTANNAPGVGYLALKQASSGTDRIRFDANSNSFINHGNFGLGTTSPTASLHIRGTAYDGTPNVSGTQIREGVIEMTRNGSNPFIDFQNDVSGTDYDARLQLDGNDYLKILGAHLSMNDYELRDIRALQLKDWDDNTGGRDNKYRLLARDGAFQFYNGGVVVGSYGNGIWSDLPDGHLIVEGNTGLGTTSPTQKLDVRGKVNITNSGGGFDILKISAYGATSLPSVVIGTANNAPGVGYLALKQASTGTNRILFDANSNSYINHGNFGIGTTNPTYKLSVNGTIRAKEVIVETGWSDFVFEEDYRLRTLKEVEAYINENGHLPEIPSAKEVEENGVKVGEMESKLLQKIEELTLYLIEKEKQIEKLSKDMAEQQRMIEELKKQSK
ncbi:MAG: hypothetical protein AAFX87_05495 [Bacteroidota bacterium]